MRKSFLLKLLMLAICAAMVLALFACDGGNVETEAPETEAPEATDPAETDPTESTPAETNPTESNPAETDPSDDPADTDPADDPADTDPAETDPAETDPAGPTCDGDHDLKAKGDNGHYELACEICGTANGTIEAHTYGDDGITCTACGHVATCGGVHNYDSNAEIHWINDCIACGAKGEAATEHTPVYADGKYACTVCGYVITCPTDGVHELVSDGVDGHHTAACVICNAEAGEVVAHTFADKDGSRFCECGYEAECKGVHKVTSSETGHAFAACDICGAAATQEVPHNELKAEFVTDTEFVYGCKDCGYAVYTKTITANVSGLITPALVHYNKADVEKTDLSSSTKYQIATSILTEADNMPYVSLKGLGTVSQLLWNRHIGDVSDRSAHEEYTFDVGQAKFLVIKARATMAATSKVVITLSTVGAEKTATVEMPLEKATENAEWVTYVIDLAKAFGDKYAKAEGADTYVIDTFYFHMQPYTTTDVLDIAYMAFVEGGWSDIGAFVDEENVIAVTASNLGNEVNATTGVCVGEHVYATTAVDGEYKSVCVCGYVKSSYGIKEDGPNKLWGAEIIANNGGITGYLDKTLMYDEDGTAFVRVDNFWPNRDRWGDFSVAIANGIGNAATTGRYIVIKYRVSETGNGTNVIQVFANTNKGASGTTGLVGAAEADFTKTNDNQWHTVVIDLATRVADPSKAFVDEGDGTYNVRYLSIRAFAAGSSVTDDSAAGYYSYMYYTGSTFKEQVNGKENKLTAEQMAEKGYDTVKIVKLSSNPNAYVDFAFVALCDSMDDLKNIVTAETYELSVDNSTNAIRNTADNSCAKHAWGEVVDGTTHTIQCLCGEVLRSYEISADINYFANLSTMNKYTHSLQKLILDEEEGLMFNRYTGTGGNHINITGGTAAGSPTSAKYATGKYLVMKYRATGTTLGLNVATGDLKSGNGKSAGTQALVNLPGDEWRVAVVDVSGTAQWTSDGSEQQIYIMITTGGSTPYVVDIAYVAIVDSIDEMKTLLQEGETYYNMGTSWANTPAELNQNDQCVGDCTWTQSGDNVVCGGCGTTISSAVIRNAQALGMYTNYNCTNNSATTNGYATWTHTDETTGYTYARLQANPYSTAAYLGGRNLLGGSSTKVINYMVIRYRVGENNLGQNEMTFYFNTESEAYAISIPVVEDNQWHTVIIDLKAYVGDGTVYEGTYTMGFFRPFGNVGGEAVRAATEGTCEKDEADAIIKETIKVTEGPYVDLSCTLGCATLDQAVTFVGADTYEWFNGETIEVRDSATHQVVAQ